MKATGTKTATTDRVTASTASAISEVPFRAASQGDSPSSRCRTMFSMTTMASSMRRPIDSVSASIVMTLKVKWSARMTAKVPMIAVGSATAATRVERQLRRKRSTTRTARIPPMIMSSCTDEIDERMNLAPSMTTASLLPAGSCPSMRASASRIWATTLTVFAPDCLRTTRPMALCALSFAPLRASPGPSRTCATWPRRTGTPPGLAITIARIAATERASAATFTDRSAPGSSVRPPGTSSDCARSAATTSAGASP